MEVKHRLFAIRFPDGLPETEPLVIVQQSTFDQARGAIQGLLDIGKRDLTNPKYDGYFDSLRKVLAAMEATL